MKPLIAISLLAVFCKAACAGDPINVDDLAAHLGIVGWSTKVDLPAGRFLVAVMHLVDGKIKDTALGGVSGLATDADGQRLAVIANEDPLGMKITIQIGSLSLTDARVPAKRIPCL
jgi:hypothetical protein